MHPRIFVISGPSGAGKTTIIHGALEQVPELRLSVSYTTRAPRAGETDGKDYYFTDAIGFDRRVTAGEFLEWAHVFDNQYGTTSAEIGRILGEDCHALLDVDVQGAKNIQASAEGVCYIFLMPPSMEELATRLRNRGTETEESLAQRLAKAEFEASHAHLYDHVIVNDDAEPAIAELVKIVRAEELIARPFRHNSAAAGRVPGEGQDPDEPQTEELVRQITREMGPDLREEMISLINNRVRSTLQRDLDRLILDTFRNYRRRDC
jgi:guanylate kinase